jgi:hypothetical protein
MLDQFRSPLQNSTAGFTAEDRVGILSDVFALAKVCVFVYFFLFFLFFLCYCFFGFTAEDRVGIYLMCLLSGTVLFFKFVFVCFISCFCFYFLGWNHCSCRFFERSFLL